MPELPEVETIVRGLRKEVLVKKIIDVWNDSPLHFLRHKNGLQDFKKQVIGSKIKNVTRLGKNIIFELSNNKNILLHLKMTGRLLLLDSNLKEKGDKLFKSKDPYIHTIFYLSGGKSLFFSDVRKFGKVLAHTKDDFYEIQDLKNLGRDALKITFEEFQKSIGNKKIAIKNVLLNQEVIAGIGNIYADEILFLSRINPLRPANKISIKELKNIYSAIFKILNKAIKLRGSSMSDYQDIQGKLGNYFKVRLVYGRKGEKCPRCKTEISQVMLRGRSMHFCEKCQNK